MATKKAAKKSGTRKAPTKATAKRTPTASSAVDQQLAKYRSMRDFGITDEPAGGHKTAKLSELPFVIQKHAATRLHYDFRLGWNGVLKSWAVAKGPSYVVADKRLAVEVEDHPMEYGGFEGIIPKGQYGGGTVMVWDHGTWEPQPGHDVDEGLKSGSLKFILHGEKLKGKWALIRMKGGRFAGDTKPGAKPNWLLIKEHDDFERGPDEPPVTEAEPDSVVTGRSIEQIAAAEDHVWNSKETSSSGQPWYKQPSKTAEEAPRSPKPPGKAAKKSASLGKLPKEKLPEFLKPQLAVEAINPPTGSNWIHELKLDGYRIQAHIDHEKVKLFTRRGLDWTHRMRPVAAALAKFPATTAILDGELCAVRPDGTTSFADLQASFEHGERRPLTYFVFDLLHLDGHNPRDLPLLKRKAMVEPLLTQLDHPQIQFSQHLQGDAKAIFQNACSLHAEGIICKRGDAPYRATRSPEWLKLKCIREQEFVVGGFTLPSNAIRGVGALLLGYYNEQKQLIYAGRTGTGFNAKIHKMLRDKLETLRQSKPAFYAVPPDGRTGAIWVKPELVAQVTFTTWTADNLVRQAAFQGLREDKPAEEVRREEPTVAPSAKHERGRMPMPQASLKVTEQKSSAASVATKKKATEKAAPVRLTHPDKILDTASQLTKRQLAEYYWAVAPYMLPHIANRPLSLVRCPDGAGKQCFFQKHVNHMLPPGITGTPVPDKKTREIEQYITLSTPEALAGLAQMGVLEVHPWGSKNDDLERPDRVVIDLDPDTAIPWNTLCEAAADVRARLKKLGLTSFLKTTGGKGLHVVIPITPKHEYPAVKEWAHELVLQMERDNPRLYLTKMSKAARANHIFLDYLRNERGATAVAPFSPRAREGAHVSLPLPWTDLKLPERPVFTVVDFETWKPRLKRDPWKEMGKIKQQLPI
ncbi:DNA ligase D [Terriglobus albidus]|uniref:DNA ligase D n=1 Tax=Terriglobus albidus TaxID=1592106 RepID=UPI0021E05858|nr:DNA ligase D [Terriglobus albidus]